jgi:hypothetical protein
MKDFLGWLLVLTAIVYIAPSVPTIIKATSIASQQFQHDFQELQR